MDNIIYKYSKEDKKCYYNLENYVKCTENKNIYFKECYNKLFISFLYCSKILFKKI
jgi:hypothetical protein